jgi:N-acetylglutamate synthase-like GNAT family acetyltransferase
MVIRVATMDDAQAVTALLQRSYPVMLAPDYPPQVLALALPHMTTAQPKLLSCGTYYVWEGPEGIIGAGGWTVDATSKTKGHIRRVASDPAHLRRGIAAGLIARCIEDAGHSGITEMECWSKRTAQPFYESIGFVADKEFDVMLGGKVSFPSLRMLRPL